MHKDKIVGFISGKDGSNQEFTEFGTYTSELKEIRDWFKALDGTLQACLFTQLLMLLQDYDHVQKQVDLLDKSITEIISEHYARIQEHFYIFSNLQGFIDILIHGETRTARPPRVLTGGRG
jgi:hypothetical protein